MKSEFKQTATSLLAKSLFDPKGVLVFKEDKPGTGVLCQIDLLSLDRGQYKAYGIHENLLQEFTYADILDIKVVDRQLFIILGNT
jgi:hypothetical protein